MSGLSFEDYLRVQASGDRFVKLALVHVDMAGDLLAGAMLSRLVYWHSPDQETGEPRLTFERNGYLWLRRTYGEWHKECRLTPAQARGAVERLQSRELVETRVWKHRGTPTLHLRIVADKFMEAFNAATAQVRPEMRQSASQDGNAPERISEMRLSADPLPTEESTKESRGDRPEIGRLCDLLAERIIANVGARKKYEASAKTKAWRDACRLLLDVDGKTPEQVERAIIWATGHEFWRSVVLSMAKLRAKYDQMSLQAREGQGPKFERTPPPKPPEPHQDHEFGAPCRTYCKHRNCPLECGECAAQARPDLKVVSG